MNRILIRFAVVLGAIIFASGCTHSLEVTNLQSYRNMQMESLKRPITVGIVPSVPSDDADSQRLVKGIATELGKHSASVILPYIPTDERKADIVANISVRPDYSGSGWNFLINWPGFLIFTPAWHGYVYELKYDFLIGLTKATDNSKVDSWSIPVTLDVRHASFNRTWTEIGWLEWGIIPLFGGLVFMSYDDRVTPLVVEKIETPLGEYIAQDIVHRINGRYNFASTPAEAPQVSPAADKSGPKDGTSRKD